MEAFPCGDSAMIGHNPCSFMICIIFALADLCPIKGNRHLDTNLGLLRIMILPSLIIYRYLVQSFIKVRTLTVIVQLNTSGEQVTPVWPKADPFFSLSFSAALVFAIHVFIVRYNCSDPCIKWSSKARMLWTFIIFFQPIPVCRIFIWIRYGGWKVSEGPICINTTHLNFSSECLSLKVAKYCSVGRLLLQYACDYRKFKLVLWRFTFI